MASPRVDPADWHVPTLDEVFDLAAAYPGGPIFLDTKLPPGEDEVARRMGEQYLAAFTRQPALRGRAFIACPDAGQLAVMQEVFAADPAFADFRDFALDHEELSGFVLGHDVDEATPLRGAGDNRWLSIGAWGRELAAAVSDRVASADTGLTYAVIAAVVLTAGSVWFAGDRLRSFSMRGET